MTAGVDMSVELESDRLAHYTSFLQSLELMQIALVRSAFKIDRDKYMAEEETKNSIRFWCEATQIDDSSFDLRASFSLRLSSPKDDQPLLRITAQYELHFHAKAPVANTDTDRFAESEARLLIWPYFREFVSNTTARMHVPPVLLPYQGRPGAD
jgi:hypothetical protein